MKRFVLLIAVLALVGTVGFALDPYDSDVSVAVMRANGAAMGQLGAASSDGDFLAAAGALATLASGSMELLKFEAPKGDQDEWDRIHTEIVTIALRGIAACAEEDADALGEVVAAMSGFPREGHSQFR